MSQIQIKNRFLDREDKKLIINLQNHGDKLKYSHEFFMNQSKNTQIKTETS